jgi:hypothetical protein
MSEIIRQGTHWSGNDFSEFEFFKVYLVVDLTDAELSLGVRSQVDQL